MIKTLSPQDELVAIRQKIKFLEARARRLQRRLPEASAAAASEIDLPVMELLPIIDSTAYEVTFTEVNGPLHSNECKVIR